MKLPKIFLRYLGLNLNYLRVEANDLTSLTTNMFGDVVQDLTFLYLLPSNNPWHCDFNFCWIKRGNNDGWLQFFSYGTL